MKSQKIKDDHAGANKAIVSNIVTRDDADEQSVGSIEPVHLEYTTTH